MEFQRARKEEQFMARKSDIINAAVLIYNELGVEGVTFSKISERTKFTRPTIYSYFKTKEEILLKLTLIYLEKFVMLVREKLEVSYEKNNITIANILTESLTMTPQFIHLYTILFSVIEKNVSLETLTEFKKEIIAYQTEFGDMLKSIYIESSDKEIYDFLVFFLCFASGLYPMCEKSEIQAKAIDESKTGYVTPDFTKVFQSTLLIYLEKLN